MVCANRPNLRTCLPTLNLSDLFILGLLVVLFFRCMAALFDPAHHRGRGIRWGLISYTVIMFLAGTVVSGMGVNAHSNSYINNREFSGVGDALSPGPLGYQSFIFSDVPTTVSTSMFFLNGWFADGLLVNPVHFCVHPPRLLTPALLALSLLHHLLQEPLGRRISLLDIPRIFRQALDFLRTSHDTRG